MRRSTARAFAREGATVFLAGRTKAKLDKVADEIRSNGGASEAFMYDTAMALAKAMPNPEHRTLEGQAHAVSSEAIAPVLVEFFTS